MARELTDWLEKLDTDLGDLRVAQERHTALLEEHMRRTELLEVAVDLVRADVRPLTTHVAVVTGLTKVLGALAVLAGGAVAVAQLMGKL